jgi:serine-type D-Ala-D-Ala carboxypeptidase (penicillin-binding protein 5/6)
MRRLIVLLTVVAAAAVAAGAPAATPRPEAGAWYVQNGATGEVLLEHRARERRSIASITKLMTVLVALERAGLDDVVTVAPRATKAGESTINLRPGERVTVRDLVEASLIQSANDAANALAAHVGGGSIERFVGLMNAKARALGLRDTHFVRPDGLDVAGHVSSARDVTVLGRIAMQRPEIRAVVRRTTDEAAGRRLHTWNDLLTSFPGVIGVKTGHTADAGWSQVAAARGRGLTIYATLLGSATRAQRNSDLTRLLAWGLSRYRAVEVVRPGHGYASAETQYGRDPVRLVPERGLLRVVRVHKPLVERVVAPTAVELPIRRGQRLGEVRVYAGRKLLGSRPLVAAETIERPSLAGRVRWYAGETLRNAWDIFS